MPNRMTQVAEGRSELEQASPGAECRESGTFRSEWELGGVTLPSTPNKYITAAILQSGSRESPHLPFRNKQCKKLTLPKQQLKLSIG
jgi:hypothetical protein